MEFQCRVIVQRRCTSCCWSVENIPLQAERHSARRQKLFAFPPEWAFTFRPECCSESQRNRVRLQSGIAFTFHRIPHIGYLVNSLDARKQCEADLLIAKRRLAIAERRLAEIGEAYKNYKNIDVQTRIRLRTLVEERIAVKLRSGGLVLPRRLTPLPRRNAVYFCSGAYNC